MYSHHSSRWTGYMMLTDTWLRGPAELRHDIAKELKGRGYTGEFLVEKDGNHAYHYIVSIPMIEYERLEGLG